MEATNIWDRRNNLSPACIFLPQSADEVAESVALLHKHSAQFAIRGGGHMNRPGSNNINDGVLLALNHVNHIRVTDGEQSVEVGPGNTWADVYNALGAYGRYAIGGRLKAIGVPGLALIGGFHYFINKYGFAMDNVLSYDVVLRNGTHVIANATSNADLFWALKGGANNFGIVTNFVLKTFDARQFSTTTQVFDEAAIPDFIRAVCDLTKHDDPTVGAGAVITITKNATTKEVSASLLGVQEGVESPPTRFANFFSIPAVTKQHAVMAPKQWHSRVDSPFQMFRIQFGHHSVKPDHHAVLELYDRWRQAVDDISDVEGLYPTFVLNMVPRTAATVAKTNGISNTWGLDDVDSYIWWQLSTAWDRREDDMRVSSWSQSLLERLHAINRGKGLVSEFLYIGDSAEYQNPYSTFPPESIAKMREVRAKYDVGRVFTKLNWGGFKLGY
ncbi:FAD binding domain containing protein [Neofusicoccum parvum]|uniref:FAD binding domain containing protein n=1 Tax=Neofusicoccum parvum TaxID=310453 RepID=A0ACB5SQ84_9PEZI|nr:FAD binding domain containing protein [Neofusicoccum parvum]